MTSDPRPSARPSPPHATFHGPSIDGLIDALLRTVEAAIDPAVPTRALELEVWADQVAPRIFERESQTEALHEALAVGLVGSSHPLALGVLAALAVVLEEPAAEPLRRTVAELRRADDDRHGVDLLGIGRHRSGATEIEVDADGGWELSVELDQPGCPHRVGIVVDSIGVLRDAFVGPPSDRAVSAGDDPSAARVREHLDGLAPVPPDLDPDARRVWPLVARRLHDLDA